MPITEVRIRPVSNQGKVKALASITFAGVFAVHGLRVIEGQSGLFVAMPSQQTAGGSYRDLAHPVTAEARAALQQAVLVAYLKQAKQPNAS